MHCGASRIESVSAYLTLPVQRLLEAPDNKEWQKFLHYAARLRVLGHRNNEFKPPLVLARSTAFILLAMQKPVEWMFPNLRRIAWQFDSEVDVSGRLPLSMMLSPRVEDIMIKQTTPLPQWVRILLLNDLSMFAISHSNLQHLQIHYMKRLSHATPLISDVSKWNKDIRRLGIWRDIAEPLPRETWQEIASLPRLEKTIMLTDDFLGSEEEERQLLKLSSPLFPSLRHATIQAHDVARSCRYLDFIHSSSLKDIAFIITYAPTNEEVKMLFTKLAKHPSRASLRHLSFASAIPCPPNDDSYIITADTLRLLLSFQDLIACTVVLQCPTRTDDAFLSDVATAWGKTLVSLEIGTGWRRRSTEPRAVTLTGLVSFVPRCPYLSDLGVEFTPNVADFQHAYDAGKRPFPHPISHVARFYTGTSSLRDLDEAHLITLAGILSDIFPLLLELDSLWDRDVDWHAGEDPVDLHGQLSIRMQQIDDAVARFVLDAFGHSTAFHRRMSIVDHGCITPWA